MGDSKGRLRLLGGVSPGECPRTLPLVLDGYSVKSEPTHEFQGFPPGSFQKPVEAGRCLFLNRRSLPSAINSKGALVSISQLPETADLSEAQNNISFPSTYSDPLSSQATLAGPEYSEKCGSAEQEMLENFSTTWKSCEKMVSAEQETLAFFLPTPKDYPRKYAPGWTASVPLPREMDASSVSSVYVQKPSEDPLIQDADACDQLVPDDIEELESIQCDDYSQVLLQHSEAEEEDSDMWFVRTHLPPRAALPLSLAPAPRPLPSALVEGQSERATGASHVT